MKRFDGFMHGVNLGGWFSQCDYSEDRYNNFIKENDIKTISEWGLDHVRLPVDYNLFQTADEKWIEAGFDRITTALEWCRKYNLNMILDLHKTAGFSFDKGENETGFFDSPAYQERFYKIWEELARRYTHFFDGTKNEICFELLNEVTDQAFCKTWNAIARTCIERIRAIAPTTKILVGSYWNNSLAAVKDLDPPYDENIVYNFHCYDPLVFTHQGAGWLDLMDTKFRMPLKSTYEDYTKNTEKYCGMVGNFFNMYDQKAKLDLAYFENNFAQAIAVAEERGAYLYCGEYGVIENASVEDTVEWYRLISEVYNKHGVGRAAWSYKEMNFGLSDARLDSVRNELVKYL